MRRTLGWMLLLALVVALFFWKILFTSQFSMILGWEGVNQGYAWYNYAAKTIQQGILPAWDPFTESGRNFVGETQTGVFYPLKLLLYLWPLNSSGLVSERVFHSIYVLAHLMAAIFMFLCAKEVGVKNNFAAFVAAICFALGGFVGKMGWVHLMDSLLWLPLVFLFLLRALRAQTRLRRLLYACCAGLGLGMAILAGSIHAPFMDAMVVVSAAIYFAFQSREETVAPGSFRSRLIWCAMVVLVVGVISFCAGALQLLPSLEYAPLATRWTLQWSGPFQQRIPYYVTGGLARMAPRSLFAFLYGMAETGGAEYGPYFGIMPLLLTVVGVWRNWEEPWVKYLTVLGVLAFLYGLGNYSLLHGVLYLLVPYIDKMWEAGRFIYLTHFAMALLAGFGVETLLSPEPDSEVRFSRLNRILGGTVAATLLALGIPALLGKPEIKEWPYATLLFLIATWAVFYSITRGNRAVAVRVLLIAVILSDLYVFNTTIRNRMEEQKANADHVEEMLSLRPVAAYFKAQPGLFRVHFDPDFSPASMGDVYGVQTTLGYGATMISDYLPALWSPLGTCLFNVRYFLGTGKDRKETPVFTSGSWKVYENPSPCPRAWLVRRVVVDSPASVQAQVRKAAFDPRQVAYLSEELPTPMSEAPSASDTITFGHYQADRMELDANISATGLMVLSEVYYPGWAATVNGQPGHIYKVDSVLRGLILSPGVNHIVIEYQPASIRLGALLSGLAFLGTFLLATFVFWKDRATAATA